MICFVSCGGEACGVKRRSRAVMGKVVLWVQDLQIWFCWRTAEEFRESFNLDSLKHSKSRGSMAEDARGGSEGTIARRRR